MSDLLALALFFLLPVLIPIVWGLVKLVWRVVKFVWGAGKFVSGGGATKFVSELAKDYRQHQEYWDRLQREQFKICEHCAEQIKAVAKVCRYCGRDVPQ